MNCRTFYGVEIAVMRRFPRPFALGLAVVLATGLLNGVVVRAEAETEFQPRALRRTPSVPVVAVTGAKQGLHKVKATRIRAAPAPQLLHRALKQEMVVTGLARQLYTLPDPADQFVTVKPRQVGECSTMRW